MLLQGFQDDNRSLDTGGSHRAGLAHRAELARECQGIIKNDKPQTSVTRGTRGKGDCQVVLAHSLSLHHTESRSAVWAAQHTELVHAEF